jgi:hypothetical protein
MEVEAMIEMEMIHMNWTLINFIFFLFDRIFELSKVGANISSNVYTIMIDLLKLHQSYLKKLP